MVLGDCEADPATLTEQGRAKLHLTEMLPLSLKEALEALKADTDLAKLMGPEVVERYLATKKAELAMLAGIPKEERKAWIIERY